jgi:fibronectin type III domain protein
MAARPIAVLKLSLRIKNVITFAQSVATAMTGNASLASPNPTLATFEADIAALVTAETAVLSRVKGAVETRNAKLVIVKNDLVVLRTYVQSVADANPSTAEAIIEGAGMTLRTVTLHDKPALSVKLGDVSGSVLLAAKAAADRAAYDWQYSIDQKTWTEVPQTLKAKTSISGLTAGTMYYFRVQALIKTGEQNWSQVVSVLVS